MPLQEFWYDDPDLLWTYRNLYVQNERQKYEIQQEIINFQCWLQGLYNQHAIASVLSKNFQYFTEPIKLKSKPKTEREKKLEVAQKIKENMKRGKAILEQRKGEK